MGLYIAGCFTGAVVIFIVMMMAFFLWSDQPEEGEISYNEIISSKIEPIEIKFVQKFDKDIMDYEKDDFIKCYMMKVFGDHIGNFLEENPECYSLEKSESVWDPAVEIRLKIRLIPYLEQEVIL